MGKGSLWRVEQQYKQNLIIALTRSSYHPNTAAMEKATASLKNPPRSPESSTTKVFLHPALPSDLVELCQTNIYVFETYHFSRINDH